MNWPQDTLIYVFGATLIVVSASVALTLLAHRVYLQAFKPPREEPPGEPVAAEEEKEKKDEKEPQLKLRFENEPPSELRFEDFDRHTPLSKCPRAEKLWRRERRARRTTALIFTLAGLANVFTSLLVLLYLRSLPLASRFALAAGVILLWPVGATALSALAAGRLRKALAALAYVIAVLAAVAPPLGGEWGWLMLVCVVAAPAIIKASVMSARLRNIGVIVMAFVTVLAVGASLALWFTQRVGAGRTLSVLLFVYIVACSFGVACLIIMGMAQLYRKKFSSDQTIVLHNFWLIQTEWFAFVCTTWFGWGGLLAAFAFVGYSLVAVVGLSLRQRHLPDAEENVRLLLLRTFHARERTQRLLRKLEARWRYVGSIQLITSDDLAEATLEPNELIDFFENDMRVLRIENAEELERKFKHLDLAPDRDGRFRVNEFFCDDSTWQEAVSKLLDESDAVLMDLRDYSEQHGGVEHEIEKLFNDLPLNRLLVVLEEDMKPEALRESAPLGKMLHDNWKLMSEASPNYVP
ncbi:MAG: hypothetical protein M3348_00115, partial [Acidobacteriota bacterium]|nr:hypothetical protein [Acidobacteriota bacterium]